MAISVFELITQSSPFSLPGLNYVYKLCQASTPDEMEGLVQKALDEVVALNVQIAAAFPDDPEVLLTVSDVDLGGGGDGFTFVCTLTFVPASLNLLGDLFGISTLPESVKFRFTVAGDGEDLQTLMAETAVRVLGDEDEALVFFQAVRGASSGTRFMGGIGAVVG